MTMTDGLDRMRPVVFFLALGFAVAVVARTAGDAARERERIERWVRSAVASGAPAAVRPACPGSSSCPAGTAQPDECQRPATDGGPVRMRGAASGT